MRKGEGFIIPLLIYYLLIYVVILAFLVYGKSLILQVLGQRKNPTPKE